MIGNPFNWYQSVARGRGLTTMLKESFSAAYGARNLRRFIQKNLEDPIATRIIESYLEPISVLKAVVEDGKIGILSL